jgi:hypothetical protein
VALICRPLLQKEQNTDAVNFDSMDTVEEILNAIAQESGQEAARNELNVWPTRRQRAQRGTVWRHRPALIDRSPIIVSRLLQEPITRAMHAEALSKPRCLDGQPD